MSGKSLYTNIHIHEEFRPLRYEFGNKDDPHAALLKKVQDVVKQLENISSFKDGYEAWNSLGVQPENIESFRDAIGEDLFKRFMDVTLALVEYGYMEQRDLQQACTDGGLVDRKCLRKQQNDVDGILKRIVHEEVGGRWYRIESENRFVRSGSASCDLSLRNAGIGSRMFEDLNSFLRSDVRAYGTESTGEVRQARYTDLRAQCYSNSPYIEVDMPEVVFVSEGETATIPIEIKTSVKNADMDLNRGFDDLPLEDYCEGIRIEQGERKFDLPKPGEGHQITRDSLVLSIDTKYLAQVHEQPEIPITLDFVSRLDPFVRDRKTLILKVVNDNEPPAASIKAPGHIDEGKEVCIKAEVSDPEGDEITRTWSLKEGNAELKPTDDGNLCVTAPVTGQFVRPLEVELAATDVIDQEKYPGVQSKTTMASARIYIDPTLKLPGGVVAKPPQGVVELMSDPDIDIARVAPMAVSDNLYVFLHLPSSLDKFVTRVSSNIAIDVAVDSQSGVKAHTFRKWSSFTTISRAGDVAVSYSPVRRWTPAGTYKFGADGNYNSNRVDIRDKETGTSLDLPIEGEIKIEPSSVRTRIEMDIDAGWGKEWVYYIRMKNVIDEDGVPFYKPLEEIPITVFINKECPIGRAEIQRQIKGKLISPPDAEELVFEVPIYVSELYASGASVSLDFSIRNRYGESAHFRHWMKAPPSSRDKTIFDEMDLSVSAAPPFPWYSATLTHNVDRLGLSAAVLSGLSADVEICPTGIAEKFIDDCSKLVNKKAWNRKRGRSRVRIPLKISDSHGARLAKAYRALGGKLNGSLEMDLPEDPNDKEPSEYPWQASIYYFESHAPSDPKFKFDIGSFRRARFAALDFESMRKESFSSLRSKVRFTTERQTVKPGDIIHVEMHIPTKERGNRGNILLAGSTSDITKEAKSIVLGLKPQSEERGDVYNLKLLKVEKVRRGKYKLTYRVPNYLPRGAYTGEISPSSSFYVDYKFFYGAEGRGNWSKVVPVSMLVGDSDYKLKDLSIVGSPDIAPTEATGRRIKK